MRCFDNGRKEPMYELAVANDLRHRYNGDV